MSKGQIGIVSTTGFMSWLIRIVTRSDVNHAVVDLGDGTIASAEPGGVRLRLHDHFPNTIWSHFEESPEQASSVTTFAREQLGTKYAYFDDLLIGIAQITGVRTPNWIQRRLASNDSYECAELADASLQAGGVHVFTDGRVPSAVFPGDFEPIFKARGWWPDGGQHSAAQSALAPRLPHAAEH